METDVLPMYDILYYKRDAVNRQYFLHRSRGSQRRPPPRFIRVCAYTLPRDIDYSLWPLIARPFSIACVADLRSVFGRRVRELREERQLSQEALAHAAGIHVTYLSGIENGKRNPGLLIIGRLARALSTPIAELFSVRRS